MEHFGKAKKIYAINSIHITGNFMEKKKREPFKHKNCKNFLNLILGALFSRSRFTFCWTSAYQASLADFKSC